MLKKWFRKTGDNNDQKSEASAINNETPKHTNWIDGKLHILM
jgi:hypothetical protein